MKIKQMLNILNFSLGGTKPISGPLKAQIEITHRCNSRCRTCGFWKKPKGKELSAKEHILLLNQLKKLDVQRVSYTGGEPLLRKDITNLISHAKKIGLKTNINSNGLLLEKRYKEIAPNLDSIAISLDSPNPEVHDKNRGVNGAFNTTVRGIKRLMNLKKRPEVQINMTLNKNNINQIEQMVDLCAKLKVDYLSLEPAHSLNSFWDCPEELKVNNQLSSTLKKDISRILRKHRNLLMPPIDYYKEIPAFFTNPKRLYRYRCSACYGFIVISPEGDIYSCPVKEVKIGNIKETPLKDLWFSSKFNKERKRIKNNKHAICWFNSTSTLNLIYHYMSYPLSNLKGIIDSIKKSKNRY